MQELEVNGQKIDRSGQFIAITRQVIDPDLPIFRKIDITNRFKLPFSDQNIKAFDFPFTINSDSISLDKIYPAKVIDQSPIFNGTGWVTSYNKDSFDFNIADISKELLDNLKEEVKKLSLDDQDILFNSTSYDALKLYSSSNLWIWPIVSMHEDRTEDKSRFTSGDAGLKYSRPMFNMSYLINKLITSQGWGISFDTELIDNVCLSSNHDDFFITSYQKELSDVFDLTGTENLTGLDSPDFNKGNSTTSTTINIGGTKQKFRLRGDIEVANDVKIQIKSVESSTLKETTQEFYIKAGQSEIDFTSKDFSSSANSITVEILIIGSGSFKFLDTFLYTIISEKEFSLSSNPLLDYKIKAYDNLLKVKQVDLLKLYSVLTNSVFIPDSFEKNIQIKTLKNLNKLNAVDWSEKFDQKSEVIYNKLDSLGKSNELIYDNDKTISPSLGKDTFSNTNNSLEDVKEYIKIPFAATNDIELNSFSIGDFDIYSDDERENELNPRLLFLYNNSSTPTYTLARFLELDWRLLKENYYKNWFDSLKTVRKIVGYADLNKLDVLGFDFTQLVYIECFNSYFFVQMIEDYVPGKKTKVTLLKFL